MTKKAITAVYDLETTTFEAGRADEHGGVGSITQIASVLADENLNVIDGTVKNISVKPRLDSRPSTGAIEITAISLSDMLKNGISEYDAINGFRKDVTYNDYDLPTVIAGYNNFSFDDNWVSTVLYRNGFDPYEHTYKGFNGEGVPNSRLDIFSHIISVAYALRPEILEWPKREDGTVSLKLEDLSVANGIIHENAHDAESDVLATVGLGKIVQDKLGGIFEEAHRIRNKAFSKERIETAMTDITPLVNISSMNGKDRHFTSIVLPITGSVDAPDQYYILDLEADIEELLNKDPAELVDNLYVKGEKSPISNVWANKSNLFREVVLRDEDKQRIGIDYDKIQKNIDYILNNPKQFNALKEALSTKPSVMPKGNETYEKKGMISGLGSSSKGFFSYKTKGIFKAFHKAVTESKIKKQPIDFDVATEANKTDDKHRAFDVLLRAKWLSTQEIDFKEYKIESLEDYIELKELRNYLNTISSPINGENYNEYSLISERIESGELSDRQIEALNGLKKFLEHVDEQNKALDKEVERASEIYEERIKEHKGYANILKVFEYDKNYVFEKESIKKESANSLEP